MARFVVKTHRAFHVDEVRTLSGLGVGILGFDVDDDAAFGLSDDPLWADERYVAIAHLPELCTHARVHKPLAEVDIDRISAAGFASVAAAGIRLIQVPAHEELPQWLAEACAERGIEVVYDRMYIESSDVPSRFGGVRPGRELLGYHELQVLPSEPDAWGSLTDPNRADDVVALAELEELAARTPLLIGLNATPDNIVDIARWVERTPIAGLSFTLSDAPLPSFHTHTLAQLVDVLEALAAIDRAPDPSSTA